MVTPISSKSKIFLQYIWGFMIRPKQVTPEITKSWIPPYQLLQPCLEYLYKFVTYYMIDHNYNIDTWNIRKQVVGYIMSLKRKRRTKLKAKGCAEGHYHRIFNNVFQSSSDFLRTNTHKSCCVLNTTDYNCKLRSVIGREDDSKVIK